MAEPHDAPIRTEPLPILRWRAILVVAAIFVLPFLLVRIPPLTDVPGHIGRFAVAAAPPGSIIHSYFDYHWQLTFNLGADVLVAAGRHWFGLFGATWLMCAAVPAITVVGLLAVARRLNPRGAHGLGWALIFVYNYCFLWGFFTYALAAGASLCGFALWMALETRPGIRATLFVVAPPVLLLVHGVGGLLLPVMIGGWEMWRAGLYRPANWRSQALAALVGRLWPLLGVVLMILAVRIWGPAGGEPTRWLFGRKLEAVVWAARDQSQILDIGTVVACILLFFVGWRRGARLHEGAIGPVAVVLLLFLAIPSLLAGSDRLDTRLAPMVMMLALALQDWSGAAPVTRRWVAASGFALLAVRMAILAVSFVGYDRSYADELRALDHVRAGSRVLNLTRLDCSWGTHRLEHIANLATPLRSAWVNSHWAIEGLQSMQVIYRPSEAYARDPSQIVWSDHCIDFRVPRSNRGKSSLRERLAELPLDKVDYLWLIAAELPPGYRDPRLTRIWTNGNSELYQVRATPVPLSPARP